MPKYIISEGKYSYTSDILLETNTKAFFDKTKNHIIINSIFETKDFLFIRFNKKYGYYDKKQDRFFTLKSSMGISNDYDGGLNFWPMHQKNNELIGFFDAYLFEQNINEVKPKGPQKAIGFFNEIHKNIDPEDNPIMVIVKLKQ